MTDRQTDRQIHKMMLATKGTGRSTLSLGPMRSRPSARGGCVPKRLARGAVQARAGSRPPDDERLLPPKDEHEHEHEHEHEVAQDGRDVSSADWTDLLEIMNRERLTLEGQRAKTLTDLGDAVKQGARRELDTATRFVSNLRGAILKLVVKSGKE